jgi:hypothetical protein
MDAAGKGAKLLLAALHAHPDIVVEDAQMRCLSSEISLTAWVGGLYIFSDVSPRFVFRFPFFGRSGHANLS